jgi:hypothetical protein
MTETNPFAMPTRRKTYNETFGVGMSDPNPTGIPTAPSASEFNDYLGNTGGGVRLPPMYSDTPGGYSLTGEYRPPTGGINPGGMYSGTSGPSTPAPVGGGSSAQTGSPTNQFSSPTFSPSAPAGWNQTKWSDSSHTTPKYTVGRILSQFPDTPEGLAQAMPHIQAAFPGATLAGRDSVNIPGIGIVDVGVGFSQGGGQGWAWQPDSEQGGAGGAGAYGSSGAGGGGGAYGDDIRAKISQLIGQNGNPMDSPVYQNSMRAYSTEQQRATEAERNAIAERMAASGQANSGAMDSRLLGAEQASGEAKASFGGALAERAMMQQRDEIMQALQIGANLMTEQQRIALTEKLGLINANLQQQGITNQNNQFNQNLGWDQAAWEWLQNQSVLKT